MGFPYVPYCGCPVTGITLRASPSYKGNPVFHFVAVRWAGGRPGRMEGEGAEGRGPASLAGIKERSAWACLPLRPCRFAQ